MTTARLLRYAALAFATVGLLCTVLPGLLIEDHLIPTLLCGSGAICAIAAIRGRASWSWHALGACLGALAVALIVQGANRSTVSAVVASGLFAGMLQNGTSLAFASLGGLFSERSGVTNIGLEGMLLTGCFTAFWACEKSGSWIVGVLAAGLVSGVLALVHAVFAIHLQADQIVTGTAVNILAAGGTAFAYRAIYGTSDAPNLDRVPEIGGLSGVPLSRIFYK